MSSRLKFTGDPKQGDASISVSDLKPSDTATYQCKVKKAPGVDMRKVTLVVMGEDEEFFFLPVLPVHFLSPLIILLTLTHMECFQFLFLSQSVVTPSSAAIPQIVLLFHTSNPPMMN